MAMATDEKLAILSELKSETCYCGSPKKSRETFCKRCYFLLPNRLRRALYSQWGSGYVEAYVVARNYLKGQFEAKV
jgi:hypothetical protein